MDQRELDALVSRELLLEEQKNTTRRSLSFGMKQNPDEYAGAVKLGKETKTSTDFALKHKNDLELKKRMQVFPLDSFVRETPRTAEFLSNPENAAIAHDDVDSMSFIEKAIAKARDYGGAAVEGLVGKGAGSTLTGTGELYNVAVRNLDRLLDKVLPNSVMSALREPILPWYLDPAQVLIQPGKTLKATGEYVAPAKDRQGLDTDVISGIGQLSFQIGSYLVTGGGMSGTMLYAQGADVMAEKTKDDKADPAMRDTAIIAGAAITKLTEQYGLDKILNRVPPEIKNRTLRFLADKAAAGGIEAAQEITEGLLHDLVRKITTNENAPILEGALREGSAAGLSAAIVRAALGVRGYRQAKQQEELIVALSEGGKNSKLLQRMPEKYQELIASITKDGDVNNVFIPVGQFNTFFQSQEIDPAEAATRYGATNYSEAEALGTDVVIPIEKFAAEVAPRDDLQGLLPDVKFRQGDRTARERQQDLIDEKAREEELIATAQASVGEIQTPVLQQIKTDMEGQLIATGMERTTAEANAIQYAKVINSFAVSEGIDPLELHQQYGLGVTRPLPDVLTRDTRADINIDPILDTLRNGTVATDEQIFGKSLVEFVREQGGIQPSGELLDAEYNNRPFQRNLVQKDGLTADQIAERAIEAGYFSGKTFGDITEADIYDALDEELRGGNLTLAPKNFNEQLLNQRDQYNQLGDYLNSLGIDLRAITDNNQVRQLIEQAAGTVGLQDQVNQFFQAIEGGKNATTGDLDKVNPDVRDAVLSRMARLPIEEQQRIRDNLEQHKGTAWAAAAVKGMAYREMLERAMAGQDISNLEINEIWGKQDMSATKLIQAFKKFPQHGDKILQALMGSYEFIGGNRKAENDISTSFTNCDPSTACATHCYAAGSNARPNEIAKSEFTEFMLEYFPDQMADKIAGDYMATAAGKAGLALRLNDKGDLSAAQVTLVNNLNARGVAIQVFSKRPELLRQLSDVNLKMLSVDSTNIDVARANTDLRLAVTITDDMTQDMLKEINDRVSVYLPVNLKGKAWTAEELQTAFPDLYAQMKRETLCPVDGGRKTTKPDTSFVNILDRTSEKNVWTCTACDYTGAAGCFNGDRKTNQRKASVVMVSDLQKELQTKRVRKELQANLDALLELGGIDGELHKQLSEALSSGQRAAQSLAGYSSETGTVEGSGSAAEAFAASGDRTESTLGGDTKLFQSVEPTFYSALARAVEGAKQLKAPASDWLSIVTKMSGVKKEEIEATGLRDYLELRGKEQVTKEEISDYLNANGVQVQEVMLGDGSLPPNWTVIFDEDEQSFVVLNSDDDVVGVGETEQAAIEDAQDRDYDDTKYSSYTLPGGENYRELLLTLPTKTSELPEGYTIKKSGKNWVVYAPDGAVMASWPNRQEAIEQVAAYKGFGDNYRSSHWDQKNVLAHIRFNERTDADGNKVLFIEEIQSDWAQQGRQRGFKNNPESIMRALGYRMEKIGKDYVVFDKDNDAMGDGPTVELAMQRAGVMDSTKRSVPNAPFVGDTKAWVSLSIKRMIRYAAENGYSKVAFVNGQQSADRYDLSKQIKYLEVQKATKNKYKLYALDKSSEPLSDLNRKLFTADELSDAIGKDLAEKAVSQISETGKKAEFKGLELKVGGEGMISFYDKIVPQIANDVLKKLGGGKVQPVTIGTPVNSDMSITDMLKDLGMPEQQWLDMPWAEKEKLMDDYAAKNKEKSSQQLGFTVTPAMVESVMGGQAMFQGEGLSDKRGFIQFGAKRKFNIALLEKANLSTFLHETGHFYLEVMGDLAERPDASERIKDDYAKVLKYLGLTSRAELTLDGKAPDSAEYKRAVEAHEKFARSNEAYLMEGKAPSEELRSVFQKFRSWLNVIYKELSALNVNLTKEIREVFDRMYATDAEIDQAKNSVITVEMFATAADMGVSEAEFQAYKKAVEQTVETGKEALQAKLMKDLQREQAEWWKKAKEEMRAEVEVEVDLTPVYAAFKTLTEGKLEDGTPIRLNKESLVEKYGEQYLKRLPRSFGRIYTREGGMDTESAAEFLGFDSGDALIEALAGMKPRNEYINAEVDRRMRERYGDMLTDGSMSEEAAIALHNSQRENALLIELKALRRKQREAAPFVQVERNRQRQERQASRAALDVPPASAFRAAAQSLIDQMAVRDLNPYKYLQASRRASKESSSALVRGDAQLAGDAKQREILNHFMYLEATKAKEEADAVLKYAQRFEKGTTREQMGKAGADYLEQIDAILDRYEFRRVPLSKIDKRKSLSDWIDAQEAQGLEPNVDPRLLNEARSVNYREISMGELRGIRDTVKNIEHLARLKNKLVSKRKEIEFKDAIAELVASAENNGQRRILPPDLSALTMREKASDKVSRLDAQLLKMEQIVEWLDGGRVDGPWHTYLWNDIAQAQSDENDLHRTLTSKIVESLEQMPKAHRKSMLDVYDIPGIGKVTRKYIISMALNMGNQENIDKMMRGHDWSMTTIESALSKLSDADWRFVQDTWNNINSLWPQIVELEKRMTGVAPKKVEAQPYTVRRNGQEVMTLEGGYFPLVYDPRFSEIGAKQETGNLSQMFEQGYVRATTSKGHTEARKEGFAAPLQLDFEQVLSQHTAKVIKDLTHREAIVAANKILTNPEIRKVLQETLGTAYEQQMLPWLRSVVNDKNGGAVQGLGDFSRFMMTLRANTVAAVMGFKATTAIMQISGLSASLDKVGKKDLAIEVAHFMRHPIEMTNTVRELSGEMRNRPQSLDRDIRGQLNMMIGNNSLLSDAQRFAFHGIAIADTMVTVPTWMAAYKAAIREGKSEEVAILEGDAAVRLTQGAGGAKDLSAVQRNNELMKALTMFYSYFNVLYNRMRDMGRDVQSIKDMPKFLSRAFFTVMIPAVMGDLIVGRGPDDEEDYSSWIARKVLMYPLMSIPLLRDIASSLESGYDYKFTPLASGLEKLYKLGSMVKKTVSDEKDMEWDKFAVNAAQTIGYLAGVPGTAQMSATGKYLWRVNEGEEEADNFAELLFYAAMGKRKESK